MDQPAGMHMSQTQRGLPDDFTGIRDIQSAHTIGDAPHVQTVQVQTAHRVFAAHQQVAFIIIVLLFRGLVQVRGRG